MSEHILLVEDEESIAEALAFLLEAEGYRVQVAATGREALDFFDDQSHDLILLDLMLPEVSGTEVCRQIRKESQVPIIMLTAKDTEIDVVVGLELGADDYITKPYSTGVLLARVRALLRRVAKDKDTAEAESQTQENIESIESHGIVVDTGRYELFVRGKKTPIPLREFELLNFLMLNEGRVLTRDQLIDRVWGNDYFGDTKTLDVHVKRIRARIEENPKKPALLLTVRGVGYRFG